MLWKKVFNIALALLFAVLMILPVGALYSLSALEQAQYVKSEGQLVLQEMAYGDPVPVFMMDLKETVTLSGRVISTAVIYQELEMKEPYNLRLLVSAGDVLQVGDVIGYYYGQQVRATETGIVRSIQLGNDPHIELWSVDALAIECYVTDAQLKIFNRGSLNLTDSDGNAYTVSRIETIATGNDRTRVLLTSETARLTYGKELKECKLYTGRVYRGSLVVDSDCIFTTDGGQSYYVRLVDEDGLVIGDVPVEVGVTAGNVTCINGLEVGQFCDPGYKAVVEG